MFILVLQHFSESHTLRVLTDKKNNVNKNNCYHEYGRRLKKAYVAIYSFDLYQALKQLRSK